MPSGAKIGRSKNLRAINELPDGHPEEAAVKEGIQKRLDALSDNIGKATDKFVLGKLDTRRKWLESMVSDKAFLLELAESKRVKYSR